MTLAHVPVHVEFEARVERVLVQRAGYRWRGAVEVKYREARLVLFMAGAVAQWLTKGERLRIKLHTQPSIVEGRYSCLPGDYEAYRVWEGELVKIWPPWSRRVTLPRRDPLRGDVVYEYEILAREAVTEQDYIDIVSLEQYHYASKEEIVAVWRCPICGRFIESNVQPECPVHHVPACLQEIRGSLPSSRFLVLELVSRKPFEPRIVGYVRVDTPIPLMHRRLPDGRIEKMIREKVFPKDWFHPTYWPLAYSRRITIIRRYRELAKEYASKRLARAIVGEEIAELALRHANTAAARIARVVIHPDYRGDGLGVLAVKMAVQWIAERRIPEMKKRKHIVETIAQMARYNPFFEKAGFVYMWDTASGRPVLMYPLTEEARRRIEEFLRNDPVARQHGGRLYRPRYKPADPITEPIRLVNVSKIYSSELDISRLPPGLREVLKAFGVEKRRVERYVLREVNITINPGEVVAVVGASGAGKTTLLRMIIGASMKEPPDQYKPSEGSVSLPGNAKLACLLPGEMEPAFGTETLLEHVTQKLGDPAEGVEVLNVVGLSDAVFYRARFDELSTGQKERAKLASLLAERPNIVIVDEFAAHLDPLTAQRVARKLSRIARKHKITLIVSTNRSEILKALAPDSLIYVGYGRAYKAEASETPTPQHQ
ncbi:MAG: GNAT family N-acetyltransferase [Crenarchaeota archaeon]|nr:GNAT family N-acetyltransferase [Thermoproteota archaeon]